MEFCVWYILDCLSWTADSTYNWCWGAGSGHLSITCGIFSVSDHNLDVQNLTLLQNKRRKDSDEIVDVEAGNENIEMTNMEGELRVLRNDESRIEAFVSFQLPSGKWERFGS